MTRALLTLFFCLIFLKVFPQKQIISGYINDTETGEKLIGANIYTSNGTGTISNNYGFFSFSVSTTDSIRLHASFIGYINFDSILSITGNRLINVYLQPGVLLEEANVVASTIDRIEQRNEISVVSLSANQIKALPSLAGEIDIMKAFQLMPGIQSGNEGSSGLYVRGGSPDQNLILLDDVPLYYINHLGGFVSTFNIDAINSVKLIKGGFPARYGSRLSSVMDIRMKEGNMKEFHGNATIGIISSKIALEGPIIKNKTSYILSIRRFMYDAFTRPISKIVFDGVSMGYNFYDLNLKINHKFSDTDRIYLSYYSGDDKVIVKINEKDYNETMKSIMKWGNMLGAFRWNHLYSQKLFSNLTLTYSRYRYLTDLSSEIENTISQNNFYSGINDLSLKMDFEYYSSSFYKLKYGINSIYHIFKPGVTSYFQKENLINTVDTSFGDYFITALENTVYIENEINIGSRFNTNIGLRIADYNIDKTNYYSFEPRVFMRFLLTQNMSIKASYASMQQNIHLLTGSGTGMPRDLWVPATNKAVPEKSRQYTVGIAHTLKNNIYELSVESYFKTLNNLIAYMEGATYSGSSIDWQDKIETKGNGESYGVEFLLQKNKGKITGWIGYTFSKTTRQFDNINNGLVYPYKYDRRHDIGISIIYKIKEGKNFSVTWVFGTGNALTLPVGKYYVINDPEWTPNEEETGYIYDEEIHIYEKKNSFRMRPYHRLDIGYNLIKKKKRGVRTWSFGVYNLYNRQNPYYYYLDYKYNYDSERNFIGLSNPKIMQQSLFPIIPSISYSFKF